MAKSSTRKTAAKKRNAKPKAKPKAKSAAARGGSKQAQLVAMLQRSDGATVDDLAKKLGWQPHSVRGAFVSVIKNRLKLKLDSAKIDGRGRVYRIVP
jgi:predicted ArsR family transcriptional regulator